MSDFTAKGETKFFFEPKTIDITLAMILALGTEISALSDKLDTVIDLLGAKGITSLNDVESFAPNAEQQARRDAARKLLVETLLAPFQQEADTLAADAARKNSS